MVGIRASRQTVLVRWRAGPKLLVGISLFWVPLALLSDGIVVLLLPAKLESLGRATPTILGAVTFLGLLAGAITQPFAGVISDRTMERHGRRLVLAAGVMGALVSLAALSLASSLAATVIAFLAIAIAVAVAQAAQQGFLPDQIPRYQRGFASGLKGLADVGGAAIGFAVLGAALDAGGPDLALALIAAATVVGLAGAVVLVHEPARQGSHVMVPGRGNNTPAGMHWPPGFLAAVASRFLFLAATFGVGRFYLYFVEDRILPNADDAATQAGAMLALLALLTGLGALGAGWLADRWGRRHLMVTGSLLSVVGVGLLITATSPSQLLAFGSLMSLGSAAFVAANWAQIADVVPAGSAGRYFGLANIGTACAAAIAGLMGPLAHRGGSGLGGGYGQLFIACAVLFLVSGLVAALVTETASFKKEAKDGRE